LSPALEPPDGRQVFELGFTPSSADIDGMGHVNNVVYLRWAQELALNPMAARAPAEEQARWAWIVLRHEVDYRRALMPGETARARTWVAPSAEGPRFERFVRIDGPDGAMCAQARTIWCLIDQASGHPRRVPAWMVETFS
jgi:acyl-CoA thioester hydrolase